MFPVLIDKNKNGTATERQKSIPLLIEQQFSIKKSISFENTNLLFYKTKWNCKITILARRNFLEKLRQQNLLGSKRRIKSAELDFFGGAHFT